jgi:TP901 family phage tail tape measure protein
VSNFYGELLIRITSDTAGLSKGLQSSAAQTGAASKAMESAGKKARVSWERVGLGMQNVGRTMSQFVTIPIAAGFAVAGIAAFKFQDSLMKIQNLTGTSAAQTKAWGDELLKLGAATGQTPIKLAESLYFVASSGFKGAEAMNVIKVSAKAASAGLGDVTVTADVLTSAMNSYGHGTYTAAEVTDYLMKTIEVGKAEPVALATSLGRIMPVANQLKIGLDELGGNVAALTLGGLSSAEAVTALRGTMIALVAPAKMSIEQLGKMGLSYQEVKRSIADKGLLPTLKMLWEEVDHNELAMRKLIPNTRALNGVLSLLGANYGENLKVIDKVTNAQGALDRAMENTAKQPVQKLRVAWASLQAEFIKAGALILPVVADIAKVIVGLVQSVNGLSPGWRGAVMWMGAFVAAAMPVIMIAGSIIRSMALIKGAVSGLSVVQGLGATFAAFKVGGLASGIASMTAALGPLGIAILGIAAAAGVVYGLTKLHDWMNGTTKRIGEMRTAAELMKSDNSIKEWVDRNFGGHIEAEGRNGFEFKPATKVGAPTNLLANWVKTSEAEALAAQREGEATRTAQAAKGMVAFYQQQIHEQQALRDQLANSRAGSTPLGMQKLSEYDTYIASLKGKLEGAAGIWRGAQKKLADMKLKDQAIVFTAKIDDVKTKMAQVKKAIAENAKKPHTIKMMLRDERLRQKLADLRAGLFGLTRKSYIVRLQLRADKLNTNLDTARAKLKRLKGQGGGGEGGRGQYDPEVSADISNLEKFIARGEERAATMKARIEEAIPKITADNSPALAAIQAVIDMDIPDKTFLIKGVRTGATVPDETEARGSVQLLNSPKSFLAGEDGREIAAFFPLNNPARSASLLARLNAMMGRGVKEDQAFAEPQMVSRKIPSIRSTASGDRAIHYHSHISLPGGVIVDQPQLLADRLSPYQAANMRTAERRHKRGQVSL